MPARLSRGHAANVTIQSLILWSASARSGSGTLVGNAIIRSLAVGVGVAGAGVDRALPSAPTGFANFGISEVASSCRRLTATSFDVALPDRSGLVFSKLGNQVAVAAAFVVAGSVPMSNFSSPDRSPPPRTWPVISSPLTFFRSGRKPVAFEYRWLPARGLVEFRCPALFVAAGHTRRWLYIRAAQIAR
jgi:hypothetical protein